MALMPSESRSDAFPTPSAPPPTPPPASKPTRRHRPGGVPVWGWILIGLGCVAGAFMVLLTVFSLNLALTHDLVHEDFSTSEGAFWSGSNQTHSFAVRDGTYVITALTDDAGAEFAYAYLARKAYALTADVDVVAVPESGTAFLGLGCASPEAADGYYLTLGATGTGAILSRLDARDLGSPTVLAMDESTDVGPVQHLRLECVQVPFTDAVEVTGYVNGQPVLAGRDEQGLDGFDSVVLQFAAVDAGSQAVFDNVHVVVPE